MAERPGRADTPRRAVVVAGMHRSGTSAIARVISLLGLRLPESRMGPSTGNEFGHWGESTRIYALHEKLLAEAGSSWHDVSPFPSTWLDSTSGADYRARMAEVVEGEYPGSAPFVLKDPRICRLVPFWLGVFRTLEVRPAFVIPVRNPLEVAASLSKRDGFSATKGILLWLRHVLDAERHTREHSRTFVSYDGLLRDWNATMKAISEAIELSWPRAGHLATAEIEAFLSVKHRHHESTTQELSARSDVVSWVNQTNVILLDACRSNAEPDQAGLDQLRTTLDDADRAYGPLLAEANLVSSKLRRTAGAQRSRLESERDEISEQLGEREADLAEVRSQLDEREQRVTRLKAERSRLQSERDELGERLRAADSERALIDSERSELAERLGSREAAVAEARSELADRDQRLTSLESKWADLDSERARLEAERHELAERLGSLEADLARVDTERRDLTERLRAQETALSEADTRLEDRGAQVRSLEAELSGLEAERVRLEGQRATLDSERLDLGEQLVIQETLLGELTTRLENREETVSWLETDRARLDSERHELDEVVDSLEFELAGLNSEIGELKERVNAREAALASIGSRLQQRDERVRELERERARLESERSEFAERLGAQERSLAAVAPRLEERAEQVDSLEAERSRFESEQERLRERVRSLEAERGPERLGSERSLPRDAEGPTELTSEVVEGARRQLRAKLLTVSVVMPTYNRARDLRRALSSALGQSHAALEVIVCDDGSTDETEAMVREAFAQELETGLVRYLRDEQRRGSSAARNAGLKEARGDLIAYLDSDNAWHEHFILIMSAALSERDDAGTAYCGFHLRRDDARIQPRFEPYRREQLLVRNYIDLNAFVHRRRVYEQLGGFDGSMTRLVDWELVLRYTRPYEPATVPFCLVDYYGGEQGDRITHTESFDDNAEAVRRRTANELSYSGIVPLRIGYVLWDFPALSQTFVLSEIRHLVELGYDVHVYFHTAPDRAAELEFEVPTSQVDDWEELAELIVAHRRTQLHSHFAYPTVTRLTYPAAVAAGVPFTFMVHAVDIFHRSNRERNQIDEITRHDLCLRVFGPGQFHRSFLIEQGVAPEKLGIVRPASRLTAASKRVVEDRLARPKRVVACIARFVEKKGVDDLIRAGAMLGDRVEIRLYGYGPLESSLRELADTLDAGCVSFAGVLEGRTAVDSALEQADVFVLPCVVDSNGDMDGLPTVIGEAMAAGLPVITTDVAAIPDVVEDGITGFLVPQRDAEALARKITAVLDDDDASLRRLADSAQRAALTVWGVGKTVDALLDVWERPPIDISLVTYSRDEQDGAATTLEIIRRIYALTTTPFNLTIVDNHSDEGFRAALCESLKGRANASLILLDRNLHWGPGLNLGFGKARSESLIYVCSREGFVLRPGWEQEYVKYLRDHRDVGLAGHLVSSPAFPTGEAYVRQPWFRGFRNKRFAELNPEREFFHVQGGLFALRRSAYERCGRFSEVVAQGAADIEYSYLLESLGWTLAQVRTMPSVTRKTLPGIHAHLDENTMAAHPLSLDAIGWASKVANGGAMFCNMCRWSGSAFDVHDDGSERCPECGSTPFGRLVYRYLANSGLPFRKLECVAMLDDQAVLTELKRMFVLGPAPSYGDDLGSPDVVIADLAKASASPQGNAIEALAGAIDGGGVAIVGSSVAMRGEWSADAAEDGFKSAGYATKQVSYRSRALRFSPDGLVVARK